MRNRYLERFDNRIRVLIVGNNVQNYLKRVLKRKIHIYRVIPKSRREIELILDYSEYEKLIVDKETFIQQGGIFDELIHRGSYGITGSQGFSPYQSLQMYTYSGMMKTYRSSDVIGTKLYSIGNPDLKWQKTKNYNVSLDFTLLKNLVSAR